MSTSVKFLPFITEKSSETAIFKAIIQRTKGSTKSAIADLFSVILHIGIESARTKIVNFPDELTSSDRIKKLVAENPQYHTPKSEQLFWSYIMNICEGQNPDCDNFSSEETEIFFSAVAIIRPQNLEKLGFTNFDSYYDVAEMYSKESFDVSIAGIPGITISEKDSERIGFTCWEELKAFLAANHSNSGMRVLPVKIDKDKEDVNPSDYESNHCTKPYKRN